MNKKLVTMVMMFFFFVVWSINERRLALFLVETIVRDLQQCEYPTRREQDLNVRKT